MGKDERERLHSVTWGKSGTASARAEVLVLHADSSVVVPPTVR